MIMGGILGSGTGEPLALAEITGTAAARSIATRQRLAAVGGMVLIQNVTDATENRVFDATRGATNVLSTHTQVGQFTLSNSLTEFNNNGFALGSQNTVNGSGDTIAYFSFLERTSFFDVIEFSGNGSTQNVAHGLGAIPKMIWVKDLDSGGGGADFVYHVSTGNTGSMRLAETSAFTTVTDWNDTTPDSSSFYLGSTTINQSGRDYVAYLFAAESGKSAFNSYSGNGTSSNAISGLGFLPRLVMIKRSDSTGNWHWFYNNGSSVRLNYLNTTSGFGSGASLIQFDADGFTLLSSDSGINASGGTYIYGAWA